jgi:hypothetical protein
MTSEAVRCVRGAGDAVVLVAPCISSMIISMVYPVVDRAVRRPPRVCSVTVHCTCLPVNSYHIICTFPVVLPRSVFILPQAGSGVLRDVCGHRMASGGHGNQSMVDV